jgi:glutathione synthase/RimK-type ligase-like ATP-grasp enzyme
MRTIAFVTASKIPNLTADERLVVDVLKQRGVEVHAAVWNDPNLDWRAFDCAVVRSCWDYHHRPQAFARWLTLMEQQDVPLWNRPHTLRWNMDKTYLRQLGEQGIPIAPTVWIERGSTVDLEAVLAEQRWTHAVVKPTVSATAFHTWVTAPERARADNALTAEVLERSGLMVQQFVREVTTNGEWSLIFFSKQYSHAVLKRPKQHDFRVQGAFGGTAEAAQPALHLIQQAQRIVNTMVDPLLYARVDGVDVDGTFMLMELELIEPFLFLGTAPFSVQRFADVIMDTLQQ